MEKDKREFLQIFNHKHPVKFINNKVLMNWYSWGVNISGEKWSREKKEQN